jgi:hypothetical protein
MMRNLLLSAAFAPAAVVLAALNATETSSELIIANDRLYASVNKSTGSVETLTLDGQNCEFSLSDKIQLYRTFGVYLLEIPKDM